MGGRALLTIPPEWLVSVTDGGPVAGDVDRLPVLATLDALAKESLLRILVDLDEPTSGTIYRTRDLRLGYLPQDFGVYPNLNAVEFLEYMAAIKGLDGRAAQRIAEAIGQAWKARKPGGISFGLSYATTGRNRLTAYYNGKSEMYGAVNTPDFSHVEGYEDHSLGLLYTWDAKRNLTGVVINIACTSQETEGISEVSADFWHETRNELRRRLGEKLFILPQVSAAGASLWCWGGSTPPWPRMSARSTPTPSSWGRPRRPGPGCSGTSRPGICNPGIKARSCPI